MPQLLIDLIKINAWDAEFGYWQFDSDFIVYNIDQDCWVEPILNALIQK